MFIVQTSSLGENFFFFFQILILYCSNEGDAGSGGLSDENTRQIAQMYRQRRHISVEDTVSLGPDGNARSPAGARRLEFAQQVLLMITHGINILFILLQKNIYAPMHFASLYLTCLQVISYYCILFLDVVKLLMRFSFDDLFSVFALKYYILYFSSETYVRFVISIHKWIIILF